MRPLDHAPLGRCVSCRRNNTDLVDAEWIEPRDPQKNDFEAVKIRGFICDDCVVVHWAYVVEEYR